METGLGIINPLFFIGVVENNVDARIEGRVQVRAFGIHGTREELPTSDLPWATLIIGSHDVNFVEPPVNSFVFGFFVDGRDAQQPMILGLIPTQMLSVVDPAAQGYGAIPNQNYDRLGQSRRPQDYGQPTLSRLARGEYIHETNVLTQESGRVRDIPIAGGAGTFEEPAAAYDAQYPFNRVIDTPSGHSVEYDDTPGSERIRIFHRAGSFVEMDARGTMNIKAVSDRYDISDRNAHEYVGGRHIITIEGDSHVMVKGNKVEEVFGDYKQIVHGSHELSVAGQLNLNGSEEVQMRAARLSMESNVEAVNFNTAKGIYFTSGEGVHLKGPIVNIESEGDLNIKGETVRIGGGGTVDVNASQVNIDDNVSLANGDAEAPTGAVAASGVQLPEPASKAVGGLPSASGGASGGSGSGGGGTSSSVAPHRNQTSRGTSGYATPEASDIHTTFTSDCSTDLIEFLKSKEGFLPRAKWDHQQYSVGYGLFTDDPNATVTEAEATAALRERVAQDRNYVATHSAELGYTWNDCQIDAMTSFVYNGGRGWLDQVTDNGRRTNQEVQQAMLLYNKASGVTEPGLVTRRGEESAWFGAGGGNVAVASNDTNTDGSAI